MNEPEDTTRDNNKSVLIATKIKKTRGINILGYSFNSDCFE